MRCVAIDPASGSPEINIEFSEIGKELFAAITRENLNKRLAIVLDGQMFSAPVIRSEITGGNAQIDGNFTVEEAQALAAQINDAISGKRPSRAGRWCYSPRNAVKPGACCKAKPAW